MRVLLAFHRLMFIGMCICAFFIGVANAAMRDIINQKNTSNLLMLSLEQLTDWNI